MAFLTFRGNTTSPTQPTSTSAVNSALTNAQIDGNFASLDSSKLEKSGGTITGDLLISGELTVNGTLTTVNSTSVTVDDPVITLGGDSATIDTIKDRGIEMKYGGVLVSPTSFVSASGTNEVSITVVTQSNTWAYRGDYITISGASGTEQSKFNGTWKVISYSGGANPSVISVNLAQAVAAGTYTTGLGTAVKSSNAFFGLDKSTGKWTFLPHADSSSEVFSPAYDGALNLSTKGTLDAFIAWADVLNKPTYYIGTTAAQASSVNQALTGITSVTGGTGTASLTISTVNNATAGSFTGGLNLRTGNATGGSAAFAGGVLIEPGSSDAGAAQTNIRGGASVSGNNGAFGGHLTLQGGDNRSSVSSGVLSGGHIYITGGSISNTSSGVTKNTGSIYIDGGGSGSGGIITYGSINIGANYGSTTVSTGAVNIGNVSITSTINGAVKLPNVGTSGFVKIGAGGQLSAETVVGVTSGGTNITSYADGDMLYASSANTLSKLAKGTEGQILAVSSGTPAWVNKGIDAADDTSSTMLYPVMVSATGFNQPTKASASKIFFNAYSGTLSSISFNSLSDKRFKKDLSPITSALEKLKQLTGYTYTLIESEKRSAGLIAQEVELVQPESVGGNEEKKTIDYGSMMGLIVEAIKQLDDKVETLKNIIENK